MEFDTTQNACCASDPTSHSCSVPTDGQQGCNCASQAKSAVLLEKPFSSEETRLAMERNLAAMTVKQTGIAARNKGDVRQNIRGSILLGIACITSPCCTPFIVPVILGLLAGTPVAVWLAQNVGWVYSGLTLVSFASLVLGLRWAWQKLSLQTSPDNPPPKTFAKAHPHSAPIVLHESAGQPAFPQSIQVSTEK